MRLIAVCAALLAVPAVAGAASAPARGIEIASEISLSLPSSWSQLPRFYRNASEFVRLPPERQSETRSAYEPEAQRTGLWTPRLMVLVEEETSHAAAVRRLAGIAIEDTRRVSYLEVQGWPAISRRARVELPPRPKSNAPSVAAWVVTIAIVVDQRIVKLEARFPALAGEDELKEAEDMGLRLSIQAGGAGAAARAEADLAQVRSQVAAALAQRDEALAEPAAPPAPPAPSPNSEVGAGLYLQPGAETEMAAAANGQYVVIASQGVTRASADGGQTFPFASSMPFSNFGDPSLAWGQGDNFYLAGVKQFSTCSGATATPYGCHTGIARSANHGQSFTNATDAVVCPASGAGSCFPDQQHIAADRVHAGTGTADQVYSVWRNFTTSGATPAIVCSSDGGTTWSAPVAVDTTGDWPRVTVGPDGSVYVAYATTPPGTIFLHKYGSCSGGLVSAGSPVAVTAYNGVDCTTMPGLDRCNNRNTMASFTPAVDDTNPSHVYITYANNTGIGNENVIVRDSTDGGKTWTGAVTLNTAITGRRFMPWSCPLGGQLYVGWYDGRNATAANNDRVRYYRGSVSGSAGTLTSGTETDVSGADDSLCASGWPCAPDAQSNSESCSIQPQLAGICLDSSGNPTSTTSPQRCDFNQPPNCPSGFTCQTQRGCPKYGDYTGIACAGGGVFFSWASNTPPSGVTGAPPAGINTYVAALRVAGAVPSVTLTANPLTITAGGSSTLTWTSSGASSCFASGGWMGTQATSGSQPVSPAGTTIYTLTCSGPGGSVSSSATVTVVSGAVPVVFITATPMSVAAGSASTLRWATDNATSCTASGGWNGTEPTSGSTPVSPASTTTYSLTCTGPGGSASGGVTVTVGPASPGVSLTATPSTIQSGQSSTLAWASTGMSSCSAAGGWTGAQATSGSTTVMPTSTTTYSLNCTGSSSTVELVRNGDFSGTVTEWTRSGNFYADSQGTFCFTCPGYAYLSNPDLLLADSNMLFGWIYQDVPLPAGASSIQLSFWASISTLETSTTQPFDVLSTIIQDTSGNPLALASTLSNLNAGGYRQITYNLTAFAGRTIRLYFLGTTNATNGTVFRVDAVSIRATLAPQNYSASTMVTVVAAPPPSLSFNASPTSISAGQSSTLIWSATNAATCSAAGGWSGGKPTSGSQVVAPAVTTTYSLSCTGTGGTASGQATVQVTPNCTPPAAPTGLTAAANGQTAINLSWAAPGSSSFVVFRSNTNGGPYTQVGTSTSTSFADSGLTCNTAYFYVVTANNGGCSSVNSAQAAAATMSCTCTPPAAPTAVTATASGQTSVSVSWTASQGASSYVILRSVNSGGPYIQVGTSISPTFADSGLTCGTTYFYVVAAGNGACSSGNSAPASATSAACSGCITTTLYGNDFESGSGLSDWTPGTFVVGGSAVDWRGIEACAAHSGSHVFRFGGPGCGDSYGANDFTFSSPRGGTGIAVPAGSTKTALSFWHQYDFASGLSGGSLAISVDGSNYRYVPSSAFLSGPAFNGTIASTCPPADAATAPVFTGTQTAFANTVVDLDAACNVATGGTAGCAGHPVYIAFIGITSCTGGGMGWLLDDVTVTACQQPSTALSFYTLPPCRVVDTRGPAGPIGAPALQPSGSRTFALTGGVCGVPVTARAVSVNVTVTQPTALGDLRLYPPGIAVPPTSIINFAAGRTIANNAVIALAGDGSGGVVVQCDSAGSVQLILDVNGYFQ